MLMKTAIWLMLVCVGAGAQKLPVLTVAAPGSVPAGQYTTVQDAVTAAPETGAVIRIRPGVYRETVHIDKPRIQLRGETTDPAKVVIVDDKGDPATCGTFCSPTMFVTGDEFFASELTIANDLSKRGKPRTQGVALSITGDRAVLRDVRLLGAQDTLYAASAKGAKVSRQYFDHCYIEGEVDFIFGNAKAVFHDCEIRSVTHAAGGYLTAQSRNSAEEDSGYVFDHCRLTAEPGVEKVYLGRPWRDYATVTFLNTEMGPHILPEGWSEWGKAGSKGGATDRLKTATYAEFGSTGAGANATGREGFSKQLTAVEARGYVAKVYLRGADGWDAEKVR